MTISDHQETLPDILPIFPITGVLLLPGGQLPLNIFENKYLAMVEDTLKDSRLIGMIQPQDSVPEEIVKTKCANGLPIFRTGCAGKITSFSETKDGRYEIVLTGWSRFSVDQEIEKVNGYRRVVADWDSYKKDLNGGLNCLDIDRKRLYKLLDEFFALHDISCSWESIEAAPDSKLITALSMICPLEPSEKQGLLEASDCKKRAEMFMTMLELAIHSGVSGDQGGNPRH